MKMTPSPLFEQLGWIFKGAGVWLFLLFGVACSTVNEKYSGTYQFKDGDRFIIEYHDVGNEFRITLTYPDKCLFENKFLPSPLSDDYFEKLRHLGSDELADHIAQKTEKRKAAPWQNMLTVEKSHGVALIFDKLGELKGLGERPVREEAFYIRESVNLGPLIYGLYFETNGSMRLILAEGIFDNYTSDTEYFRDKNITVQAIKDVRLLMAK